MDFDRWLDLIFMQKQRAQSFVIGSNRGKKHPGAIGSTNAVTEAEDSTERTDCPACSANHLLGSCLCFKNFDVEQRAEFLRKTKLVSLVSRMGALLEYARPTNAAP